MTSIRAPLSAEHGASYRAPGKGSKFWFCDWSADRKEAAETVEQP
jgi:hypothetical protein